MSEQVWNNPSWFTGIVYTCRWDSEAQVYVARVPSIGQMTQAGTREGLRTAVINLVATYVELCNSRGILDKMLILIDESPNEPSSPAKE